MRTLDVGGDKSLSYFPIQERESIFGLARYSRDAGPSGDIFGAGSAETMLKAMPELLGDLHYVADDIQSNGIPAFKRLIDQAYAEVIEEGVQVKRPQIGVLIEVPASGSTAGKRSRLCGYCD